MDNLYIYIYKLYVIIILLTLSLIFRYYITLIFTLILTLIRLCAHKTGYVRLFVICQCYGHFSICVRNTVNSIRNDIKKVNVLLALIIKIIRINNLFNILLFLFNFNSILIKKCI